MPIVCMNARVGCHPPILPDVQQLSLSAFLQCGSTSTFIASVTIIPLMPTGWDIAPKRFPATTENVRFLMKDIILLTVSLRKRLA